MDEYERLKAQKDAIEARQRQAIIMGEGARISALLNPRVIEYEMVHDSNPIGFNTGIGEMVREGWQPLGGVSVSLSESDDFRDIVFAQAMVKYGQD